MQVALAWLLHRAPNVLLIPGTSSRAHLAENLAAATLELPDNALATLGRIGRAALVNVTAKFFRSVEVKFPTLRYL